MLLWKMEEPFMKANCSTLQMSIYIYVYTLLADSRLYQVPQTETQVSKRNSRPHLNVHLAYKMAAFM